MNVMLKPTLQEDTVYALARAGTTLYAARRSGLFRSSDEGATWQDALASLKLEQPIAVTAVATAGATIVAGSLGAVVYSHDSGATWQIVRLASPPPQVVSFAISPGTQGNSVIIAGTTEDGVFVSTDGAQTWTAWNFGLIDQNVNVVILSPNFEKDRTVYAGTESGIFRSENGGRSWQELPFPIAMAPVLSLAVSPDDGQGGRLYAGTEDNGLYLSADFGLSWQAVSTAVPMTAIHAIQMTAQPTAQIRLLLEDRLLRSNDGGQSWDHYQLPADKLAMAMLSGAEVDTVLVGFADGAMLPIRLT